jgi:hypothetical protein
MKKHSKLFSEVATLQSFEMWITLPRSELNSYFSKLRVEVMHEFIGKSF